jgi:hypothetical protein
VSPGLQPYLPSRNTVWLDRPESGAVFVPFAGEATGVLTLEEGPTRRGRGLPHLPGASIHLANIADAR